MTKEEYLHELHILQEICKDHYSEAMKLGDENFAKILMGKYEGLDRAINLATELNN